jgi:D-3-phosphoglycerate dehydrogenase
VKVLVTDRLGEDGLAYLQGRSSLQVDVAVGLEPGALREHAGDADAWIVRSGTTLTRELIAAAPKLRVIGRAGIGVDNIDVEAATERGVVVLNTPDANATTTAELAIAHLFSLSRHLPQADRSLREGRWERGKLVGAEVTGKSIGVVGFGTIGRIVAERCRGLRMRVLAYDPFVAPEVMKDLGVQPAGLEQLLAESDYVSVHVPKNAHTTRLLNAERIAGMKKGARLINCSRGGIVDEGALLAALESGHLAGAAVDVFETEPPGAHPLLAREDVVATPHLGASTTEAQAKVSLAICEQVAAFLEDGEIRNAINLPSLGAEDAGRLAPWIELGRRLGCILAQIARWPVEELWVELAGQASALDARPVTAEAITGLLEDRLDVPVNRVNAPSLAKKQGLTVHEVRTDGAREHLSLLNLRARGPEGEVGVEGTLLGERHPRLVRIDEFPVDIALVGPLLITRHDDTPGVIGAVGSALGESGVNINGMTVGKREADGVASAVLSMADEPPAEAIERVQALSAVHDVHLVRG